MTPIDLEEYKDALRDSVCGVCSSFVEDTQNPTRCVLETSGACNLFAKLDQVVDVVSNVKDGSIAPYLEGLRQNVCARCEHQDDRGICDIRDSRGAVPVWCNLDAYFNLVVGTIEEVQERRSKITT
jgi:hypothetical protein